MIRIAIAEDDFICADLLQQCLDRMGRETGRTFHVTHFGTGEDLLEQYKGQFDLILMDIELPCLDGMKTAEQIRRQDQEVWPRADGYVTFVDYVESIYVGYKFYETAHADSMAGFDYDTAVSRFDFAEGDVTYLSRASGFANYAQATAAPANFDRPTTVYANGSCAPGPPSRPCVRST